MRTSAERRIARLQAGLRAVLAAAILITAGARALTAQQLSVADTVAGRVIAQDSSPVRLAHVQVRTEEGRTYNDVTDSTGRYTIVVPNSSGLYELSTRAFGYVPFTVVVRRHQESNRIERTVALTSNVMILPTAHVRASVSNRDAPTPGDRRELWSSFLTESFPVEQGNLADIGSLQQGVVRSGPQGSRLGIAGQSPDQNRTTVDGASYTGGSLPSEGIRSVGVITNTYDVSHGLFSGGQIMATTISGTNIWGGGVTVHVDDPALDYGGSPETPFARTAQIGGGGGGALVRNRLFVYGAVDLTSTRAPFTQLALMDSATLRRMGVSPDSVARFMVIAQQLRLLADGDQVLRDKSTDAVSALARMDLAVSEHQTFTLRLDGRGSNTLGFDSSPLSISERTSSHAHEHGILAQVTSGWGAYSNEFRGYISSSESAEGGGSAIPSAQVQVISQLDDGSAGVSTVAFGGNSFPPMQHHVLREFSNELVRGSDNGSHEVKAGVVIQEERASASAPEDRYGAFVFSSLADLEADRPALYTRNLGSARIAVTRRYGSLYLDDVWRPATAFGVVYGLRLDGTAYGSRAPLATPVTRLTPDASGRPSAAVVLTPRIGFRYDTPLRGDWTVSGGFGGFAGGTSLQSLVSTWNANGADNRTLTCVGAAAPRPAWENYFVDANAIPSVCADGASIFASNVAPATVFDSRFRAPLTWRVSLGLNGNIAPVWGVSFDALLVHGTNLPTAVDRNLNPSVGFTLPDESSRPVYARLDAIDSLTGGISQTAARRDSTLGSVTELTSRGQSWTEQLTGGLTGLIAGRTLLSLSYTFSLSRMLAPGIPAPGLPIATTAGNPDQYEWGRAPFAPQHVFQLLSNGRVGRRFRVSGLARLSSGFPFTPVVSADINGDGYNNDRAFIFDPTRTTDATVARAMETLRHTAPKAVRECLDAQAGQVARPASCSTSWSPSVDLRADFLAVGTSTSRRLTLTLTMANVTAGLDYLLHGPDNLRGWGQFTVPDAALLEVRGFDPARRAFRYEVNPHFGQPLEAGVPRMPFRIVLQARITFGTDPRYQPLKSAVDGRRESSTTLIRTALIKQLRNVPSAVLQLAASDTAALRLTLRQKDRLQVAADSIAPRLSGELDTLTQLLEDRRVMTAPRRALLQEHAVLASSFVAEGIRMTRVILSPEQWLRLPAWLINGPSIDKLQRPELEMTIPNGTP